MACTDDPGPVPDAQIAQRNARLAAVAEARAKAELLVYVMGALLGKFGNTEISETSISQHFGALYPAVMAKKIKATVPALSQAAAARVLQPYFDACFDQSQAHTGDGSTIKPAGV